MFKNIFTINFLYYYIDLLFNVKIKIYDFFQYLFINNNFILNDVELYTTVSKKYNIKFYFDNYEINKIDAKLIYDIYKFYRINFEDNEDIRLKINFTYNNNNHILYYPLHKQIFKDFAEDKYYIPYPPYNETIISNYRKNIVNPIYYTSTKKSILYSLFMIDSKNLHKVELSKQNDKINNYYTTLLNDKLLKYFNKIKTPFNDFGLLYNCPVKVKWILVENSIKIKSFKKLFIKFLNMYFDDENFELKDHFINLTNIEDFVISERMKSELLIKNNEIINKNNL